jgi:hypothetical protein
VAGRPPALNEKAEQQLGLLLDCGVRQTIAARALGVSRRTVQRFEARRRRAAAPQTLEQLLDGMPTLNDVLAGLDDTEQPPGRGASQPRAWEATARMLASEHPERWA